MNSDIESMEMKFVHLQVSVRDSLKLRNVPSGRLAKFLMNYSFFRSVLASKQTLRLRDQQSNLENAEIFCIISPFWSVIDYRLLEEIVNDLGADVDRENLAGYITSLKEFLNSWKVEPRKICRYESEFLRSRVKLHFKLDTDTLLIYRDVKAAIARIFSLKVAELQLYSIEEGCIELVFLCPDITQYLPLSPWKKEDIFVIRPPVLKVTLVDEFETETVIFEVCSVTSSCDCCQSIITQYIISLPTRRESTITSNGGGYYFLKW